MKRIIKHLWILALGILGCASVPPVVQDPLTLPQMPLTELIAQADQYKGRAVVLGGYVVSVENKADQSEIIAVQTPLGSGQKPKSKDLSEGRVVFVVKGFIDPEVYTKGRQITVAGKVLAASAGDDQKPYAHLRVAVKDIHLWPVEKPLPAVPRWENSWYYYPYPWWYRYPYSWYDYRYYRYYRR